MITAHFVVDVDHKVVCLLEKAMFEHSKESGAAGNWQWGLDAGDHQERWVPYLDLPQDWAPGDRESESKSKIIVSVSHPGLPKSHVV